MCKKEYMLGNIWLGVWNWDCILSLKILIAKKNDSGNYIEY